MSKLKKALKKTNRGLVLGGLLIIAVVIYVAVDNHNFKSEKPMIADVVEDYIEGIADYVVFDEKYHHSGDEVACEEMSEPEKEQFKAEWCKYVDRFWENKDYSNKVYFSARTSVNIKNDYNVIVDSLPWGYVTDYKIEVENVTVKKAGPKAATAEAKVKFVVEGTKGAYFISPGGSETLDSYNYYDVSDFDSENSLVKYGMEGIYYFDFQRTDGEWKIVSAEGWDSEVIELVNEATGEEE